MTDEKRKRPNLTKFNKNNPHQFKKGKSGNAGHKIKPHSIRGALRWMAEQPLNMDTLDDDLRKLLKVNGRKKPAAARCVAVRAFEKVLKKMEPRLLEIIIDNVDGKLIQPVADVTPDQMAPESFTTLEEATEAWQSFNKT